MADKIWLTVPGSLRYRAVAVRVVAEAARLVSGSARRDENDLLASDVRDPFDTAVVSAFMEIFNNVAIHAYRREATGRIEISITAGTREIVIEVLDHGRPFDRLLGFETGLHPHVDELLPALLVNREARAFVAGRDDLGSVGQQRSSLVKCHFIDAERLLEIRQNANERLPDGSSADDVNDFFLRHGFCPGVFDRRIVS